MKNKRLYLLLAALTISAMLAGLSFFLMPPPQPHMVRYDSPEMKRMMARLRAQQDEMRSNAIAGRMPHLMSGFVPMGSSTKAYDDDTNDIVQVPVIDPKYASPTNWPDDSRPEVQAVYKFAKIAKPYKFDPVVTYCQDATFPRSTKDIATPTYSIEIEIGSDTQRITRFVSTFDSMESMLNYDGVTESWADATGKWNKRQMIDETFRVLRELGPTYAKMLDIVSQGRSEFAPEEWRVKTPDGQFKIIYPFATVKLYGPIVLGRDTEPPRVTAEYRMGPNGPVGLVSWKSR